MTVPEVHDLEGRHVAAVVPDDVEEAEARLSRLDLVVVERVVAGVVLHHPAGVPAPAVTPEVERVMVGGVVRLRPADEVGEGLLVTHVPLAPVPDRARGVGGHARGHVVELRGLPVAAALVVARAAIGEGDDLDVGVRTGGCELELEVLDDVVLEVVVARHVDHHGPLRLGCCRGRPRCEGGESGQDESQRRERGAMPPEGRSTGGVAGDVPHGGSIVEVPRIVAAADATPQGPVRVR